MKSILEGKIAMVKNSRNFLICSSAILWTLIIIIGILQVPFGKSTLLKETGIDLGEDLFVCRTEYPDIDQFLSNYRAGNIEFILYRDSDYSGSLDQYTYWFLLQEDLLDQYVLDNQEEQSIIEISKPQLDSFDVYFLDQDQNVIYEKNYGRNLPFSNRDYEHRNYYIDKMTDSNITAMLFEVNTDSYLQFPVKLYSQVEWINMLNKDMMINGLFYGAILIMFLYNLILGVSIRDKNYLIFSLFVFSYGMLQAIWDGFAFQYFWPNNGTWDLMSNPIVINLVSLSIQAFTMNFMKISDISKRLEKIYLLSLVLHLFSIFLVFLAPEDFSMYLAMTNSVITLVLCLLAIVLKKIRSRAEVLFLIAIQFFLAANGLNVLSGLKVLPYTKVVELSPKFAIIGLIALFSLALSEKINTVEYLRGIEEEKRTLLKNLHEMHVKISSSNELLVIFDYLLDMFYSITKFADGLIVLFDEEKKSFDYYDKRNSNISSIDVEEEIYQTIYDKIENGQEDAFEYIIKQGFFQEYLWRSVHCIPLISLNQPIGFIVLGSKDNETIDQPTREAINDFAVQLAITIDNKRLFDNVKYQVRHDFLTKAYNRRYFFEHSQELYNESKLEDIIGTIMIDIDDFKQVNDTYGHFVGDEILRLSVERIQNNVRKDDIIGRYGGEEFIVFVKDTSSENVRILAERVLNAFNSHPIHVEYHQQMYDLNITLSIGVATCKGKDMPLFHLVDSADVALYKAKNNGKNQVAISPEDID